MKLYRGDSTQNFELETNRKSRYGFPALFFTSDIEIARLYAQFLAKEKRNFKGGSLYEFEFNDYIFKCNFNSEVSHSSKFRNLIYELYNSGHKAVLIENVYDYPSEEFRILSKSNILVIFDLEIINELLLVETNIEY